MAASIGAGSATRGAVGPAVAWLRGIGMMPTRLTRPTVGLIPTSAATADGQMMLPSVSVPMPTAARLAANAPPVPGLEPQGLGTDEDGYSARPPPALTPEVDIRERACGEMQRVHVPTQTNHALR